MRKAELFTYGMCMLAVSVWQASRGRGGSRTRPTGKALLCLSSILVLYP